MPKRKKCWKLGVTLRPDNVQKLKNAGYVIGFYSCSEGNYKEEWETEYNAMIVNRISSKVFFVTVTKGRTGSGFGCGTGETSCILFGTS